MENGHPGAPERRAGVPGFELTQCAQDATQFILRIDWVSAEAHMEGFRRGPNFPSFLALIRPFISEIAEMRHYEKTDVVWKQN